MINKTVGLILAVFLSSVDLCTSMKQVLRSICPVRMFKGLGVFFLSEREQERLNWRNVSKRNLESDAKMH